MSERQTRVRQIYEEQVEYVSNSLRRLGIEQRHIPDLCHDVFLVVYHKYEDYDEDRPIQPWLFGIAYRVASNFKDKARRDDKRLEKPEFVSDSPDVVDNISKKEAKKLVMDALEDVDLEKRAIFVLHKIDGRKMPEIAEAMSMPVQTAYARCRKAMKQFEKAAKAKLGAEEVQ